MSARDVWSEDAAFSDRRIDFDAKPTFVAATRQIEELLTLRPVRRIVEVGSGSGLYLAYLQKRLSLPVIGSDIPSPRLDRARAEVPDIEFHAADANEMARRYADETTLMLSMNVLGNLSPDEVADYFAAVRLQTFCARGRLSGASTEREEARVGWDHNYTDLLKGFTLLQLEATPSPKFPGREAIIATAYR